MKRFLLALSFALFVPACVGEVADPATTSDETAADPLQASVPVPASRAAATPAPATSCLANCQTRYETCLQGDNGDPVLACLCFNQLQLCHLSCGSHGILRNC